MAQIIKKDRVVVGESTQARPVATGAATPRHTGAKDVELIRIDGRVHAMLVELASDTRAG